ncbi:MAG TPA: flagellar basal-body MS-ring/collar protein FliF [Terriglobia bacterium]|nr:flagellar basal-body MS-ring/collar protein FliF [Terriglobia bacterium]
MAPSRSEFLEQGKTFLRGLTRQQRIILAASLVVAAGTLWLFVSLLGRGDYKPLYSDLAPQQGNEIVRRLAQENIPAQLSSDGKTLSVPASSLNKARLDMAADGLPESGRLGFEIFDKPNWGESDFAEQVNYQRALEGELERTIQDLSDVEAVRVNLVMPHESLFTEQERPAKASVLVKPRNGHLSERSLKAITYLVASAVDTLQPGNVTVIDADGNVPLIIQGGVKPGSPEGASEYEQALDQKLEATLTPILGAGHFVARATVEYDQGSSESTQEAYDPKDSVVLTSQVTNDDGGAGEQDSGIPGAASNVPQDQTSNANNPNNPANSPNPNNAANAQSNGGNANSAAASSSSDDDNGATSDSKTYAVGRTVTHIVHPPGTIRKITAAILVDNRQVTQLVNKKETLVSLPRTPEELKQIQAVAAAVLGADPTRGDLVTVENIPFQITPLEPAPSLHGLKMIGPFLNEYGYLVRYIVLGLLGLMIFLFVVRPLVNQVGALGMGSRELPEGKPEELGPAPEAAETVSAPAGAVPALAAAGNVPAAALPEVPEERQTLAALKEAMVSRIARTPSEAGRLIEGWLREDEE